jgi:hypothetical protein
MQDKPSNLKGKGFYESLDRRFGKNLAKSQFENFWIYFEKYEFKRSAFPRLHL